MSLEEIFEYQRGFDKRRGWDWSSPSSKEEGLKSLQHGTIALAGELGEFANVIKKALREYESKGQLPDEKVYTKLRGELTDVFIYLVKVALALNMDLGREYWDKTRYNEEKFREYVKG